MIAKIPIEVEEELKKFEKMLKEECDNVPENGEENLKFLLDKEKMNVIFSDKKVSKKLVDDYIKMIEKEQASLKLIPEDQIVSRIMKGLRSLYTPQAYTRFEKARIVGARALQISYGAPILVDYPECMIDPVDIALLEFEKGLIQMSVVKK